jgi:16S rRNA (uracil1498-N3)-methyltransferase
VGQHHLAGTPFHLAGTPLQTDTFRRIVIIVGPEGSFTDQEVELMLREGCQPLDLGKRILRTETACIAAAVVFLVAAG